MNIRMQSISSLKSASTTKNTKIRNTLFLKSESTILTIISRMLKKFL